MTGSTVEISNLSFAYPDGRQVLENLTLSIASGDRVALLGPNGAGKTTLALQLNGILTPDAGTVHIGNLRVGEPNLGEIRRQVGVVFHDANDQLFMPTVNQDVAFGPTNLGFSDSETDGRVERALRAVDAEHLRDRTPHHLSAGEKRRVALATVLSMDPKVLVLDEPTSGLDPSGRRELAAVLKALPQTQLVITHDLPFAAEMCPTAAIINNGSLVCVGPTEQILSDEDLLRSNNLELPYWWRVRS